VTVELKPLGVACNIGCRYCYQEPQREAGNIRQAYDLEKMLAAAEREGGPLTLFGGEPLLLPVNDLETIFRWGFERYGRNGIQTNAILISDEHIRLFRDYNVDVGVSIDGPGELNDLRWSGTLERTRSDTEKVERNIGRLCREHRPPGLIVTLHRVNAAPERIPGMVAWMRELDALGIRSVRLHPLEIDSPSMRAVSLADEENARAFVAFAELEPQLANLRFDLFAEIERSLLGRDDGTSCVWRGCDPYTTEAVRGVEGNGQSSNCGRTNKDGVDFLKAEERGFERYLALYQTPQEEGGCRGCRFFLMCRGQCPGTAVGGDWRNRSELCGVWKRLFIRAEKALILRNEIPLSIHPVRHRLERQLVALWKRGRNATTQRLSWSAPSEESPDDSLALPSFVRWTFAGEAQRALWEPRLAAIRSERAQLAVAAVAQRVLPAAIANAAPGEVLHLHNAAAARGLHSRVLAPAGQRHRVVIGSERAVAAVERSWRVGETAALDVELGIPACCTAAALTSPRRDPVLAMESVEIDGSPATNFLLRPIGIDLLGYVPCSFGCEPSRARGEELLRCAREAGFESVEWLEDMLSWPLEWSALHGIAEVKMPVLKFIYDTDYTGTKRTVRYRGSSMPVEAARGLSFAFRARPMKVAR
jgi:uncharacterized protein